MQKRADDHPSFVKMNIRGQTTEGRNITVMKLGTSPKGTETPAVWFDAGKLKIKSSMVGKSYSSLKFKTQNVSVKVEICF